MIHLQYQSLITPVILSLLMTSSVTSALKIDIRPVGSEFIRHVGASMLLTCHAGKDQPDRVRSQLKVRWISEITGREITDTHGPMYVETDVESPEVKKLYITSLRAEDAGTYTCQVYSSDGKKDSRSVKIQLFQPITFDLATSPQNPILGTSPVIQCRVSGSPSPTVSWRFKGRRIGSETSKRYEELEDGLKIKNISERDNGEYTCRAEVESEGRYNDRLITVQIFVPSAIQSGPGVVTGLEGTSTTLSCKASGVPEPSFTWSHRPMNITQAGNEDRRVNSIRDSTGYRSVISSERIGVDNNTGILTIQEIRKEDEGLYRCSVVNAAGKDESVGSLKVQVKPKIFQFENATVVEGASLLFNCRSQGDPAPEMRFVRGTKNYRAGFVEENRISVIERSSGHLQLVIQSAILSDAAEYICMASSSLGEDRSTAFITVNYAPKFSTSIVEVIRTWPGQNRTLGCQSSGSPPPRHVWLKGDRVIENNSTFLAKNLSDNKSTLLIRSSVDNANWIYGRYSCKGTNFLGEATKHYDLLEGKIPAIPVVVPDRIHPGRVDLNVTSPRDDGGVRVEGFTIDVTARDEVRTLEFPVNKSSVEAGLIELHVDDLDPNTNYVFRVKAKNAVGLGKVAEIAVKTPPPQVPARVWIIPPAGECPEPNKCTIVWHRPLTGGLPVERYEISWRSSGSEDSAKSGWFTGSLNVPAATRVIRHLLTSLHPSSVYEIKVTAFNKLGASPASVPVFIRTAPGGMNSGVIIDPLSIFRRLGPPHILIILALIAAIILFIVIDLVCYCAADCGLIKCLCQHICRRGDRSGDSEREKIPADDQKKPSGSMDADKSQDGLKDGSRSPNNEKLTQIAEEPMPREVWIETETTPASSRGNDDEAELTDEQCRLLADHEEEAELKHDVIVDVRERPVPAARKSILSTGDERWRSVVKELEKELGVQKCEEEEEAEGRPIIKLTDSIHGRPLSQGSSGAGHPHSPTGEGTTTFALDSGPT